MQAIGVSLITFTKSSKSILTTPPTVSLQVISNMTLLEILQNCVFRNFIYNYNAIIDISNDFGGYISISNTIFDRMTSTCGTIIRNFRVILYPYEPTSYSDPNFVSDYYSFYVSNAQRKNYEDLWISTQMSASCSSNCYSITIDSSSFTNFNAFMR